MADRLPKPARKSRLGQYADARIADAFGQSYDEKNQGWGDWMWQKGGEAIKAGDEWLAQNTQPSMEDVWDTAKAVPSALTRIGENFLGQLGDFGDLKYELARAINDKLKGSSGMDLGLGIGNAKKFAQSDLPGSEGLHTAARQYLPGAATYEPKRPLGQALHVGADFVNPEDLFPPAAGAYAVNKLIKRFR